jgi:hypothetical protein
MNGYRKYQEMRFDPTCASLLKAIEYPIRACRHFIEPASDDPKDVQKADHIHDQLWEFGSQSMDDILRLAFGKLTWGFAWSEICYAMTETGPWAGKWGWDKFAWRSPATKWRWNMAEIDGRQELASVTQLAPPFYHAVDIPREKLLLWVNDQEGDNYDGISTLRPAYKPYVYRDVLYRIQAIGLQRSYMGIPRAKVPAQWSTELKTLIAQILENLRTDETAGFAVPADVDIDFIFNRLNGDAMQKAINHHDVQIVASALADFLKLGTGDIGSFALSSDKSELFLYALNGHANYFDQVLNLYPGIPLLITYNFADADPAKMPKLVHGDIGQRALDKLGRTLAALTTTGFLTPDDATEDKLRQMLDFPERDSSITDRALADLVEEVFPRQADRGRSTSDTGPRLRPKTLVVPPDGLPTPVGQGPDAGQPVQMSERKVASFRELQRMVAQRPFRRATNISTDRTRIQMSEMLIDALQDARSGIGDKPERPSIRMAKARRPYKVLAAPAVTVPRPPRAGGQRPPTSERVKPHTARIRQALYHVGSRSR